MDEILEEDLDPPPRPTEAEIVAALDRSVAQIAAGQTVDGEVFRRDLRARIDAVKTKHNLNHVGSR